MRNRFLAGTGLMLSIGAFTLLPSASLGDSQPSADPLARASAAVKQTTERVATAARQATAPAAAATDQATSQVRKTLDSVTAAVTPKAPAQRTPRAPTATPQTDPPLHGTNNHGQGSVAVVDLTPSDERPQGGDPSGKDSGEDVVAGRARGEQQADGSYHGHITIAALFGNELAGVDTKPGETKNGPLQPLQSAVLDPLCDGSANQVCLSVLTANSTTTADGTTNDFAVARAQLGGASGLGVGAAESQGTSSDDGTCQTSTGTTKTANVTAGPGAVANAANSSSSSKSCRGASPVVTNTSQVIGLGGTNVPLPAAGCDNGTPDTVTGIPTLAPIVCNADTVADSAGVREALDVFVLAVGGTSLTKETTAASESKSTAPAAETSGAACSDGADNDGDGVIDAADPGCHSDGNAGNPASYVPSDTSEANTNGGGTGTGSGDPVESGAQCSDGRDNDGDGLIDRRDPGCHSDGNANNASSYNADDDSEAGGGVQCADGRDNDGDGLVDRRDPGCHSDGNANNASSYNASDDSEAGGNGNGNGVQCADGRDNDGDGLVDRRDPGCHSDGDASNAASYDASDDSEGSGAAATSTQSGSLPFTGVDLVSLSLAALLLFGGGLLLRRRGGTLAAR